MRIQFKGIYAIEIRDFINLKRHCGYKYQTEEKILLLFDKLTMQYNEDGNGISEEFALRWSKKRDNESDAYRYKRCIALNQFVLYLNQHGKHSAISYAPKPKKTFVPYIYTIEESATILNICDNMECVPIRVDSIRFMMPALIRFLMGTGVRISEALNVQDEDMDLVHNVFVLRDTKNNKERLLPFTDSLSEILKQYRIHRERLNPKTKEKPFFLTARGRTCTSAQVYKTFRDILTKAGIPFKGDHRGPNIHCLRHTFAVRSLLQMVREDVDIYCSLPILSTYLGHQSIEATNNYVRLTTEMYPELTSQIDKNLLINVFPYLNDKDYEDE